MAEKRGFTEKLKYDFNTAGSLEVLSKNTTWNRATPREFRSFDGQRRITEPTVTVLGDVDVPMKTYEYNGPVYAYGTNKKVEKRNTGQIIQSTYWNKARASTKKRGI